MKMKRSDKWKIVGERTRISISRPDSNDIALWIKHFPTPVDGEIYLTIETARELLNILSDFFKWRDREDTDETV